MIPYTSVVVIHDNSKNQKKKCLEMALNVSKEKFLNDHSYLLLNISDLKQLIDIHIKEYSTNNYYKYSCIINIESVKDLHSPILEEFIKYSPMFKRQVILIMSTEYYNLVADNWTFVNYVIDFGKGKMTCTSSEGIFDF